MRFATLGTAHEANTFSAVPASLDQWERAGILVGDEIVAEYAESDATIAGFLELGRAHDELTVVPLVFARITPMGTIPAATYETLAGRLVAALEQNGPWDGVLLALHGAAVSEEFHDADGETTRRVRALVGPGVPIGVTLDMHANLSQTLIDHADIVTVYQTTPHVDPREKARLAGELTLATARGEIRPAMALETPPLAVNILRQGTSDSPMRELVELARRQSERPGVLSASIVEGFPYADVEHMGMAFLAVTDDDPDLARDVAQTLARSTWDVRQQLNAFAVPTDEAMRAADAATATPIVLLDTGDNVGGGSPGDSTFLLAAAQRLGVKGVFGSLCDPAAVAECVVAGVGATVRLSAGGKTDHRHGDPIAIAGTVERITDGRWEDPEATHGGFRFFNTGTTVLLRTEDGHDVLLTSTPEGNVSLGQLRAVGLEPTAQRIIIAKGVNSPRAAFEPIAGRMVFVGTPGVTSADLSTFEYEHRRLPMFPYEADAAY